MKITCEHCKTSFESCPDCNSNKIECKNTFNLAFMLVAILACLVSAYRWYDALDEFERAQRLRRAFLKERLDEMPKLPIAK